MSEEDMRREIEQVFPGLLTNGSITPDIVIPAGEKWTCETCEASFGPVASHNVSFTVTTVCHCGLVVELLPS